MVDITLTVNKGEARSIYAKRKRAERIRVAEAKLRARKRLIAKRRRDRGKAKMRKARLSETPVSSASPQQGWRLIARRQISAGGMIYPCGSEVPAEACGKNLQALLGGHFLEWQPPGTSPGATPYTAPPPDKPKLRPTVTIIPGADAVESAYATLAHTIEACGGDEGFARDLISADRDAAALFRLARAVACGRLAKARGVWSVSPSELSPRL